MSEFGACHHTIRSASARSPATSYQPRITRSSSRVARSIGPQGCVGGLERRVVQRSRPPEHRPHRVADGVVDLPRLHAPILPRARLPKVASDLVNRRVRRAETGGDPDPVQCRPGDGQSGHGVRLVRSRATSAVVADAVLRQAAAPAGHRPGDQFCPRPARERPRLGERPPQQRRVVELQHCGLALPADAGPDHLDAHSPDRRRALRHPVPLGSRVGERLDRRQLAGRHQHAGASLVESRARPG